MSWFLVILFLILKFSTNLSEATNHHDDNRNILPSAFVVGTVYCDTCLQQTFTKESHFISGASIAVECKVRNSKQRFYTEVKTNEQGEFKVKLPFSLKKHKKRIKGCSFKLISSSEPHCAIASTTSTTNSLSLKKKTQQEHIFSAGVFSFQPMKIPNFCDQKHHSTIPNSKEHVFKEHKHSIANFKEHVYVKHSTQSSKKSHFSDQKDFSIFPPLIPNPFQPPPLIPNPFQPPSPPFIPNPFQPPSPPPFLPNPFQPPPSSPPPFIPNPFQPPPSSPPPSFPFPPLIPGLTPSPPPPPPPKSIFPPFPPLFPPPLSPGSPPTSSKHSSP